jgi:hypothetical protein
VGGQGEGALPIAAGLNDDPPGAAGRPIRSGSGSIAAAVVTA